MIALGGVVLKSYLSEFIYEHEQDHDTLAEDVLIVKKLLSGIQKGASSFGNKYGP